jgi:hypothetical protein
LRYFITLACYGARLHGAELGSVDRSHNLVGSPPWEPDPERVLAERREIVQDLYVLDEVARSLVLAALRLPGWNLLAAHVGSNPVHVIVETETRPERIRNQFKSYASLGLNRDLIEHGGRGMEALVRYGRMTISGMHFST